MKRIEVGQVTESLMRVRHLISDPAHWTKGTLARDEAGRPVGVQAQNAHSFCLFGAVHRIGNDDAFPFVFKALGSMDISVDIREIPSFNDSVSHTEVLGLLDTAIQLSMQEGV